MNILLIIGSNKKNGVTSELVNNEAKKVAKSGDKITTIYPSQMNINSCLGCDYCRKVEGCSQKDDMSKVFDEIYSADLIIMGTPIYFGEMSGQLKTLIDRLHPGYRKRGDSRFEGKKLIRVFAQGSKCERYKEYRQLNAENCFELMGFDIVKTVVAGTDGVVEE